MSADKSPPPERKEAPFAATPQSEELFEGTDRTEAVETQANGITLPKRDGGRPSQQANKPARFQQLLRLFEDAVALGDDDLAAELRSDLFKEFPEINFHEYDT